MKFHSPTMWARRMTGSLFGLALLLSAFAAHGAAVMNNSISGLHIEVSAVDPQVFHVLAYSRTPPRTSPFVVESIPWRGAAVGKSGPLKILKTREGRLVVGPTGAIDLKDKRDHSLLVGGHFAVNAGSTTFIVRHGPNQRFYGSGNAGMGRSGGLIRQSGVSGVSNGTTRIPFIFSTGHLGMLVANDEAGVRWDDQDGVLTWQAPGPSIDLYLVVGRNPYNILDAYTRLTGRAPIPPRWTFGYMQSRWGYNGAPDVQDKWNTFRRLRIPVDAFIYDYDWFNNDWEWNRTNFPNPAQNLQTMKEMGLHFVGIRKPRVNGAHIDYARVRGWMLDANDLRFDLPDVRAWWWDQHRPLVQDGVDGWWNDEAEQAYDEFFYMAKAEWDGWRGMSRRRAWSINRAFTPGMQRLGAAVWTGDITSDWNTLRNQPGTLLNFGLCGMSYSGQDIGGFNGTPSPELYTRWMQEGVFVPVMRAHGTQNSPRWPWAFGDDVLEATRQAIELRYRLVPYLYTFGQETFRTGAPLMRPLFMDWPRDPNTFNLEDEWLVGREILAAPILNEGGKRAVYLPRGLWYDFNTGQAIHGPTTLQLNGSLDSIPFYVRGGSILPLGPVMQYTGEAAEDPMEIRLYPGANGIFWLYEDEGDNYNYNRGAWSRIPMHWDNRRRVLLIDRRRGSFPGMLLTRHFHIVLPNHSSRDIIYTGQAMEVRM